MNSLALGLVRVFIEFVNHLLRKLGNSCNVVKSLGRKSEHEIKLDRGPAALKRFPRRSENLVLSNVFIDSVAQALSSGLRRKGQSAAPDLIKLFHKLVRKIINTKRGQRNIDFFRNCPFKQFVKQRLKLSIVACTQRRKGNFVIAGNIAKTAALTVDCFGRFFPYRAVQKACLTETTAADTAAQYFMNNSVMNNFNIRNNKPVRISDAVKIGNNTLSDFFRCAVFRNDCFYCFVLVVFYIIKRGYIHSVNTGGTAQKFLLGAAVFFAFFKEIE